MGEEDEGHGGCDLNDCWARRPEKVGRNEDVAVRLACSFRRFYSSRNAVSAGGQRVATAAVSAGGQRVATAAVWATQSAKDGSSERQAKDVSDLLFYYEMIEICLMLCTSSMPSLNSRSYRFGTGAILRLEEARDHDH